MLLGYVFKKGFCFFFFFFLNVFVLCLGQNSFFVTHVTSTSSGLDNSSEKQLRTIDCSSSGVSGKGFNCLSCPEITTRASE